MKKKIILSSLIIALVLTSNIFSARVKVLGGSRKGYKTTTQNRHRGYNRQGRRRQRRKRHQIRHNQRCRQHNPRRINNNPTNNIQTNGNILGTGTNQNYQNTNNLLRNLARSRRNRNPNRVNTKNTNQQRPAQTTNPNSNINLQEVDQNLQQDSGIRNQIHDAFVRNLIHTNIITNHRRLQNGDYLLQIRSVNQGDRRILRNVRGQICPAMALRSVQLMINYFENNEDQTYLGRINDLPDTINFLINLRFQHIAHINLHSGQIENILSNDRLSTLQNYTIQTHANDHTVMVIDSVEDLIGGSRYHLLNRGNTQLPALALRIIRANDGFYHGFIIGTNRNGGGHWISGAVYRRNGRNYWFVVESGTPNRLNLLALLRQRISSLDPELD